MEPLVITLSETTQLVLGVEQLAAIGGVIAVLLVVAILVVFRARAKPIDDEAGETDGRQGGAVASQSNAFMSGFARSRALFAGQLARWNGTSNLPELEELEEVLISADVGVRTSMEIVESLRSSVGRKPSGNALRAGLVDELKKRVGNPASLAAAPESGPLVILVVGVNGSGKTTTIGKLAARYARSGKKVLLAAGDTFRAGAIEQLKVWGERANVPVVAQQEGADPAAVIFDALQSAVARKCDVVICDTAGRLQAQSSLMEELGKVVRVMKKAIPSAPHEVLLVLDGTIGQNALSQARSFKEVVGVTGVALTKLDGTAKGGVVVAVRSETGLPVKLVGLGEGIDDLRDFEPDAFVDALVGAPPA